MELSDQHLQAIKEAARKVSYGSVTLHIVENGGFVDIDINQKIRIANEPTEHKNPMPKKPCSGYQD